MPWCGLVRKPVQRTPRSEAKVLSACPNRKSNQHYGRNDITSSDFWEIKKRLKMIIPFVVGAALIAAIISFLFRQPKYESSS